MIKDTDKAVAATTDAMRKEARSEASQHRPGYRLSLKSMKDSKYRGFLQDAYDEYEERLVNAHKNPEPVYTLATTLDEEFDDNNDMYQAYDQQITNAWKGE